MANKSSKSPSGEDRENNEDIRDTKAETQDTANPQRTPPAEAKRGEQENLQNRGFKEDQPNNPVRSTGSTKEDQESMPTGEPDPDEV